MEIKSFNDFKSEKFKKVFTEYFFEEGITLKENTTVFDEIQNNANEGKTKAYVIENNDRIIAFIMYRVYNIKSNNKFLTHTFGYIEELYVVPEERNKKLASMLINRVESEFKANNIYKIALTSEPEVYDFYKKLGYNIDNSYSSANNLKCFVKDI